MQLLKIYEMIDSIIAMHFMQEISWLDWRDV